LAFAVSPSWSLDSGWAETEGGRMRLVVDPELRADGTILAILDIDLDPGWKTYWRDPGSAGIPPMLDFSQSKGVTLEEFHYPPPVRVDDGYAIWAGYTAPVQFPLTLRRTATGDAEIRAEAFIGICAKICVPFQAALSIDLPQQLAASDAAKTMIADAVALLPEPEGSDFRLQSVQVTNDGDELEIEAILPNFRPRGVVPELFVAGPEGLAFAPPTLLGDDDGVARWRVRLERRPNEAGKIDLSTIDAVVTLGQRSIGANLGSADPAKS
jgi:DsbC/DsbD-like thiol-disulfide interchange protein